MYSTQKIGTFAVVEARNAPCPMEWGCPKDRSMTVVILLEKKASINGVVVTWVVAIDPPGVRFPLNALSVVLIRADFFSMSTIEHSR